MNSIPHFDWSLSFAFLGLPSHLQTLTLSTAVAYAVLGIFTGYHMLAYLDYPVLPIPEIAWNCLVYLTPLRLISILDPEVDEDSAPSFGGRGSSLCSQRHAAKSEAMRRILGLDGEGIINKLQQAKSISSIGALFNTSSGNGLSDGPPGLGNWDNSCYQNSVIQGLASLPSLSNFLSTSFRTGEPRSAKSALRKIIAQLNDLSNSGKIFWTPPELKNMSSWQQQDAQEYYSKLLDEVEKEIRKTSKREIGQGGFSDIADPSETTSKSKTGRLGLIKRSCLTKVPRFDQLPDELASVLTRNPLEGLLAQRVGCLRCGFVEGLSLIPFNCLTVPLGKQRIYDVRTCLDDYTTLEYISGVDCTKCTLLQAKKHIERLLSSQLSETDDGKPSQARLAALAALKSSYTARLSAVDEALNADDFSDNTLLKKCQIPNKTRISPTKSRQAIIGRPPKSLVIHINRSVFDEFSGLQRKNLAHVQFPLRLDLAPWCLGNQRSKNAQQSELEDWSVDPSKSMLPALVEDPCQESDAVYELRSVITHYGRHENGHYICYRKHRLPIKSNIDRKSEDAETWWRLSDDEVSEVSEEDVLAQGGVFMLFYEKAESKQPFVSNPADPVEVSVEEKSSYVLIKSEEEEAMNERSVDQRHPSDEDVADRGNASADTLRPKKLKRKPEDEFIPQSTPLHDPIIPEADPPSLSLSEPTPTTPQLPSKPRTPTLPSTNPIPSSPSPSPSPHQQPPQDLPDTIPSSIPSSPSTPPEPLPSTNPQPNPSSFSPPKADSPKPVSSPPMRTAGPRGGRGSAGRADKGMGNVGSMVEAN